MKTLTSILAIILLQTCQPVKTNDNEMILWINSSKIDCTGVSKMTCLQVQKSDTLDLSKDWELFYSQIDGFEYQPGFLYKLKVKTVKIENPPADGSTIKYILVEELEKKEDTRYAIHDIYVLTQIDGKNISEEKVDRAPTLEINVSKMQINGTNGCNNFGGKILKLDDTNIEFGPLRETMMMCAEMEIPTLYSKTLILIKSYKRDQLNLHFYDNANKNILTFRKVD